MTILINIPEVFIDYCREREVAATYIPKLCKYYIEQLLNQDWEISVDEFRTWFDDHGIDILQDIRNS